MSPFPAQPGGVGLGLRRSLLPELLAPGALAALDFVELAPENWLGVGGRYGRQLAEIGERVPLVAHGLSLSLGGPTALDGDFVDRLGGWLERFRVGCYSEHLSACSDHAQLYDLLPIPFTGEAVRHVAGRIGEVQDRLGRRLVIENASYYTPLATEMSELQFTLAVLAEADCEMLLDVNNVHVNAVNHGYDARAYIDALPAGRIRYLHVAGHHVEAEDLIVDTHGAPVADPVYELLAYTYRRIGLKPTLLERDFNFPPLSELLAEVARIRAIQQRCRQATEVPDALACDA